MHQRRCDPEVGETARDGGQVDLHAPACQDERGQDGSRYTKGGSAQARREIGCWGVRLLVAVILVSASGARAFGANPPPPADLVCSLTQLTSTTGGANFGPSINAAGTRIAFVSNADLTGGNADHNGEIFLVDTTTGSFTQLTHSTNGFSFGPSINAAGTRIAFESTTDLTGGNADGIFRLFLVDTTTGSLTQLTHSTSGVSLASSINATGTRIVFQSSADLTGDNADGNQEIFLVDTTTSSFTQLTHSSSDFSSPTNFSPSRA